MKSPAITALMPVYNGARYIQEAIDSVLNQTLEDFELLIVNDGSTDDTEHIINSYKDVRIRVINQPNGGVAKALNAGLKAAKGKYIARIDADDICMPDRFRIQHAFLEDNPEYVVAGSTADYIDMNGEYIFTLKHKAYSDEEIRNLPVNICPYSHSTVMFNKTIVLEAGGYDENAHNFEDHLLWAKLTAYGKLCNLTPMLAKIRFNPESVTIDEKWRGHRFNSIKFNAIRNKSISEAEGKELLQIMQSQDIRSIKLGAYYSLLAKKYLWNNYQPGKARKNALQIVKHSPLRLEGYALFMLSFLPKPFVYWIYNSFKKA